MRDEEAILKAMESLEELAQRYPLLDLCSEEEWGEVCLVGMALDRLEDARELLGELRVLRCMGP